MKSKIIYTETNWRKDPNLIPMQITYKRYRQSDWGTDMSGEYVYCGRHSVKRLEVVVAVPARPHWQGGMTEPYFYTLKRWEFHRDSKNNTEYQSRLQIAKNWISRFRTLTEAKDYWPLCYALEGEKRTWYDRHFCPELSIRNEKPTCCIRPFASGYSGSSHGARPIPEDRKCDLFKWSESSIPRGVPVDPINGFDLFDFYRCARKTELKYLYVENIKQDMQS